ncbi:ABC transporter permease [Gephyromycinifex aptenodytis]|uniref:ABC transporter permease n=1 Tax=Gephyromycinifex aptenodytis TaxID=2716227 RepID=UPI001D02F83C|nr:ABC transporter permease [Gephyromycinifex aptenodytis]
MSQAAPRPRDITTVPPAPGHLRMLARQSDYHWTRLRRTWKGSVVTAILNPLLYVAAMGLVLGSYIDAAGSGPPGAASYLHFIAAGLLAGQAMTIAIGDATYPIYGAITWDKTFWSMVATPLRVVDIVTAALAAILLRVALSCAIFMLTLAPFGLYANLPGALLAFGVQLLLGWAFAALVCAYSVWTPSEAGFSIIFRVVLVPLYLFSGAFFPISNLGPVLERLAMFSPLWHAIELTRALMLGTPLAPGAALLHVGVLLGLGVLGWWLSVRLLSRRLLS